MNRKKDIIKKIHELSGSKSPYDVFQDWVTCTALSIQNTCWLIHNGIWNEREEQFKKIIEPYGRKGADAFAEMLAMLVETMEYEMSDVLGDIYMEAGLGNKHLGQFFTPFSVSRLCADITMAQEDGSRMITLNEPTCGGGGMIVACAASLHKRGVNYQRCMDVVAQDLDWKAVYMCYIQLSLLGIRATVYQGDTLSNPYTPCSAEPRKIFYTPAKLGLLSVI